MDKIAQLIYNECTDRIEFDDYGLHCGDCLSVLIRVNGKDQWVDTRIEHDGEWYLVGIPRDIQIVGLWARM